MKRANRHYLSFHLKEITETTWLELHLGNNVVMREELTKCVDIQQREMIKRLDHIVNKEQRKCKYKLFDETVLKCNDLKRFFA
ncbi:hypothetical protein CKF94_17940 [Vibrio coralliilyticus]|uniref:hypothetical protein n=1 Tax=Vibrio coralliilyticus TaxID=190893 RepID=UPI000BAAF6A2|nr:hypothetical protein [Vibrio coralliilyticus]PAU36857.1 hypothetical protein CKF94_17940 [Vibrio coralliilyticus]